MTAPPRIRSSDHPRALDSTAVDHAENDAADDAEQKFSLSATQVMASMAAAVTAALVGSRLGVAGTVIGAGLASVISVVGGAVIGHSILLTRKQVKRAVLQVRGAGQVSSADGFADTADRSAATIVLPAAGLARNPAADATTVIPAVTRLDLQRASQDARRGPGHAEPGRPHPTRPNPTGPSRRRISTGVLFGVAAALAIFVSAMGAVTVFETIKGSPLAGGESGGLSVLGGNGGNPVDSPVATTTVVVTEPSTVTQTVTSEVTAPATNEQSPATQSPSSQSPSTATASSSAATPASASSQASAGSGTTPRAAQSPVGSVEAEPAAVGSR